MMFPPPRFGEDNTGWYSQARRHLVGGAQAAGPASRGTGKCKNLCFRAVSGSSRSLPPSKLEGVKLDAVGFVAGLVTVSPV